MNNLITPPPELIEEWASMLAFNPERQWSYEKTFTEAARWGADQELEACITFVDDNELCDQNFYNILRIARRPKPPSLKEQALTALHAVATGANDTREQHQDLDTIRKALETLDD